ncbi:LysR substrate-binding domain-containing protein [Nonomuraea sp. NPDC046570]|uniref:LysR substrate-binding domain-containing protein n=1 Tax=Nonomuraea sp. NPDC046570 TaxID=3155255 RepID=UPI0033C8FD8F
MPPGPVDLRLLAGSRLLIWQRAQAPAYYDLVVGAFRDAGLDPVVDTRLRRATTRVAEIASGETVAVLPSQAAAFPQPGVRYRAIQGGPTASVDVVWQAAESRREVLAALDVVRLNVVDVA